MLIIMFLETFLTIIKSSPNGTTLSMTTFSESSNHPVSNKSLSDGSSKFINLHHSNSKSFSSSSVYFNSIATISSHYTSRPTTIEHESLDKSAPKSDYDDGNKVIIKRDKVRKKREARGLRASVASLVGVVANLGVPSNNSIVSTRSATANSKTVGFTDKIKSLVSSLKNNYSSWQSSQSSISEKNKKTKAAKAKLSTSLASSVSSQRKGMFANLFFSFKKGSSTVNESPKTIFYSNSLGVTNVTDAIDRAFLGRGEPGVYGAGPSIVPSLTSFSCNEEWKSEYSTDKSIVKTPSYNEYLQSALKVAVPLSSDSLQKQDSKLRNATMASSSMSNIITSITDHKLSTQITGNSFNTTLNNSNITIEDVSVGSNVNAVENTNVETGCRAHSYCQAGIPKMETIQFPPIEGSLKLMHVSIIVRHGDRTPILQPQTTDGDSTNKANGMPDWHSLVEVGGHLDELKEPKTTGVFQGNSDSGSPGMLTAKGWQQLEALGRAIREVYAPRLFGPTDSSSIFVQNNDGKLENIEEEDVYVRSTPLARTFLSAKAFIKGFFDANNRVPVNVIVPKSYSISENSQNTDDKSNSQGVSHLATESSVMVGKKHENDKGKTIDPTNGVKNSTSLMRLVSEQFYKTVASVPTINKLDGNRGSKVNLKLGSSWFGDNCPKLEKLYAKQLTSGADEWKRIKHEVRHAIRGVESHWWVRSTLKDAYLSEQSHLKFSPPGNNGIVKLFADVADLLRCRACHGFEKSEKIDKKIDTHLICALSSKIRKMQHKCTDEMLRLSAGPLFADLFGQWSHGKLKRLEVLVAHDFTLSMILDALKTGIAEWPPYASNLSFEMWYGKGTAGSFSENVSTKISSETSELISSSNSTIETISTLSQSFIKTTNMTITNGSSTKLKTSSSFGTLDNTKAVNKKAKKTLNNDVRGKEFSNAKYDDDELDYEFESYHNTENLRWYGFYYVRVVYNGKPVILPWCHEARQSNGQNNTNEDASSIKKNDSDGNNDMSYYCHLPIFMRYVGSFFPIDRVRECGVDG